MQLIFHYADQKELELYNLADLRAVIQFLTSAEGKAELENLGGVSKATAGVILRTASDGRGIISILELANLQSKPQLFSTFLMWLLADLFEDLPEVGDVEKPKLVFSSMKHTYSSTVLLKRSKRPSLRLCV